MRWPAVRARAAQAKSSPKRTGGKGSRRKTEARTALATLLKRR